MPDWFWLIVVIIFAVALLSAIYSMGRDDNPGAGW